MTQIELVDKLCKFREELESATGQNLIDVKASTGLILYDVTIALNLDPFQQAVVLGKNLYQEVKTTVG